MTCRLNGATLTNLVVKKTTVVSPSKKLLTKEPNPPRTKKRKRSRAGENKDKRVKLLTMYVIFYCCFCSILIFCGSNNKTTSKKEGTPLNLKECFYTDRTPRFTPYKSLSDSESDSESSTLSSNHEDSDDSVDILWIPLTQILPCIKYV